jgi:hypothetical protein
MGNKKDTLQVEKNPTNGPACHCCCMRAHMGGILGWEQELVGPLGWE